LLALPAAAQDAAPPPVPKPVPRPRRPRPKPKPPPPEPLKQEAAPLPRDPRDLDGSTAAPVPDRSVEGPRVIPQDRTRLGPGLIDRNLPGRGHAMEGSPSLLEDKLFKPAPGARLNVPFSY
jgi:hypothetical protein